MTRPAMLTTLAGVGAGAEVGEALVELGGGVVAVEADRVGLDAALPHRVELGEAMGALLVDESGALAVAGRGLLLLILGTHCSPPVVCRAAL